MTGGPASGAGTVEGLFTAVGAGAPMQAHGSVRAVAGAGLEGDRYAARTGTYSDRHHDDRHLTIIAAEVLEAIEAETGVVLTPLESRRNLVSRGLELNALVGCRLRIGEEVVVRAGRLNRPCQYLEQLLDKPVLAPLRGRSGLNCEILAGGRLGVGDRIEVLAPGTD